MSWGDKDREEESVDGIAHCDFAKRKARERCETCVWKLLIAMGGKIMADGDVHSCLCLLRVWARVQLGPWVFERAKEAALLCAPIKQRGESRWQRADDVKRYRWSKSMKFLAVSTLLSANNQYTNNHKASYSDNVPYSGTFKGLSARNNCKTWIKLTLLSSTLTYNYLARLNIGLNSL